MQWWFLVGLACAAGLSNPIQSAANAALHKALSQNILVVLAIYGVALGGLAVLSPFLGVSVRGLGGRLSGVPWWAWTAGLCNLLFILASATATKQIGSATFTVVALVSAVVLSILLDQFGIMGLEQRPATMLRIVGGALAVAGVVMVARF